MQKRLIITTILTFMVFTASYATEAMKADTKHTRTWNKFADDCLKLHQKQIKGKKVRIIKQLGSYANMKNFYIQREYYHNDRLLSRVAYEKNNPKQLHAIEVFVHDNKGRVIRDFTAAYLPSYHNAPTQTLISFHQYKGNLHSFRTFDASGEMVLERCTGKDAKGSEVSLLLDDNELINDPENVMETSEYKTCFSDLKPDELGKYILPQ